MTGETGGCLEITGGCHCGQVRYTATVPSQVTVLRCNCSICSMTGFVHLIVPHQQFELTTDFSGLTEYRFGSETAKHWFCARCGVKSFYQPRSHPQAYSLNLACLDSPAFESITEQPFDGRHWEQAAKALASDE